MPPAGRSGSGMAQHRARRKVSQWLRWKPARELCAGAPDLNEYDTTGVPQARQLYG